jgi:hypothetical protein
MQKWTQQLIGTQKTNEIVIIEPTIFRFINSTEQKNKIFNSSLNVACVSLNEWKRKLTKTRYGYCLYDFPESTHVIFYFMNANFLLNKI